MSKVGRQQSTSSNYSSQSQDFEDYDDYDDEEDSGEYGMDMDVDEDLKESKEDLFHYEILTPKDLISTQLQAIEDVNTIFQIPPSTARILLQFFGWDKERLVERYYDGDQDKLFDEAHIINPHKLPRQDDNPNKELTCEICYVDYVRKEMAGLPCNHVFCKPCWLTYLRTKIMDEGSGEKITCPAHNCPIVADEVTVTNLLAGHEAVLNKYRFFVAKSFVQGNKHVKWCPAPGCENAIRVSTVESKPVKCKCNHIWCFGCQQPMHDPVYCTTLKGWLKKCADDSETANWISANTKECPRCKTTIEKNGGCNHITCRSINCKYEFCWSCLGPWEPHGSSWYNCNRFEEKENMNAQQSKSRVSLERYLHYYNRFHNHEQSQKFENQLYGKVEIKMDAFQKKGMSWIEVQFLKKAVEILCMCRQTLKYTYVFGFYLKKNNQAVIFEDNQKDLEMAVETLSQYLEQDIDGSGNASGSSSASSSSSSSSSSAAAAASLGTPASLSEIKQKVLDKSQYCESRRKVLLDHVQKGYEEGIWELDNAGK